MESLVVRLESMTLLGGVGAGRGWGVRSGFFSYLYPMMEAYLGRRRRSN
jgi:hypothetical protein